MSCTILDLNTGLIRKKDDGDCNATINRLFLYILISYRYFPLIGIALPVL